MKNKRTSLKDLCAEDKARIGEVIKRAALEKSLRLKEEAKFKIDKERLIHEKSEALRSNEQLVQENKRLKVTLNRCLDLLNYYKGHNNDSPHKSIPLNAQAISLNPQDLPLDSQNIPLITQTISSNTQTIPLNIQAKALSRQPLPPNTQSPGTQTEFYNVSLLDMMDDIDDSEASDKETDLLSRAINLKLSIKY